ncbi:conserved hypothetical protein [Enhydrobacter sp. 8BJ]|nr:DUF1819 family protein [Enhydrobacter sp. 8BJ]VXB71309.1 conserved hypothetical protein [Enhydrobacter sp. 8BJ]
MQKKSVYIGNLLGGSLMVRESRIISKLLLDKASEEVWEQTLIRDNAFQKNTISTIKRNISTLKKRYSDLSPDFLQLLVEGDEELARQVAFYGILQSNLIFVEFIERILMDAYLLKYRQLSRSVWRDFVAEQGTKDALFDELKDSSKDKIREVLYRILAEMGFIKDSKTLTLQKVLIRPELIQLLEKHEQYRLLKCMQVSLVA